MFDLTPQPSTPAQTAVDAKHRAWRTFLQGLAFDIGVAVLLLLYPVVANAESFDDFNWEILVFSLTKTIIVTAFAYLMRKMNVAPATE